MGPALFLFFILYCISPGTIILLCILVALALGSPAHTHDASKPANTSDAQCSNGSSTVQSNANSQGPADWDSIAHTLGCVFAPQSCKSTK